MKLSKTISFKLLLGLLVVTGALPAQEFFFRKEKFGFNVSANLAFGTHFRRIGVNFNVLFISDHVQTNSGIRAYFNFKNPGPLKIYPELVLSQGLLYAYGGGGFANPFISSVSNQTGYANSVAYSYNAYFNRVRTTQQTGIVAIQVGGFTFITENDILARPMLDRFRTAAFLIQYQYEDKFQAAVNGSMWTGQMGNRTALNNAGIYSNCYMDTTGGVYPYISHGLLSAQFKCNFDYIQNVQASAGIDAEQVRNVLQNRFIHDMRFIPKKWNRSKNCHIPMIDAKGEQYLYKEGQTVRKPKVYLNLFSNANVFY